MGKKEKNHTIVTKQPQPNEGTTTFFLGFEPFFIFWGKNDFVYGISTIEGYLMPNPVYTYMLNVICKQILLITFLNEPELIF